MKRRRKIILPTVAVILLAAVGLFVFLELRIDGVRDEFSSLEAKSIASSALSEGLEKTLVDRKLNYDDVVSFTYDSEGNIKSLSINTVILNTIGNEIGSKTDEYINSVEAYKVSLPVTSLFGSQLFAGMGPDISFYVTMRGITSTKFENHFEDDGVNQTRHQIFLDVTVRMNIVFRGEVTVVEYNSDVCIAESIIVGEIPSTFADF
ncbi:MAG: sporulation protein YunB [Clostridia bacterium]|nr:sporulation protein YunB [Clostridia bacterium]